MTKKEYEYYNKDNELTSEVGEVVGSVCSGVKNMVTTQIDMMKDSPHNNNNNHPEYYDKEKELHSEIGDVVGSVCKGVKNLAHKATHHKK